MNNTTTSSHRKRVGRPPGKSFTPQKDTSPNVALNSATAKEHNSVASRALSATGLDGSAEPISLPATDLPSDPIAATFPVHTGNAECRRSSRKKIVKFDVRDLLNKNRKPHKIQIEARIDSNAPATISLASTVQHANSAANSSLPSISTTAASDLTSKQKTFIEKSAIFRRYSISAEQQNKITSSQRPPLPSVAKLTSNKISMLSQLVSENTDDAIAAEVERAKIAQARRLSRTQEIFNASMQKSKQNSSLIIAQMESSSRSSSAKKIQRKTDFAGADVSKRKNTSAASKTTLGGNVTKEFNAISNVREGKEKSLLPTAPAKVPKRRGRPPKNKAKAIANSETAQEISTERIINQENPEENKSTKTLVSKPTINKALITPEKAKNWQEYKACLKVCQTQSEAKTITASNVSQSEVILEISSSSSESESESDAMQSPPSNGATKQRNFEAVSFLHEISSSVNDNLTAPEFIVASVEEILTEPITVDSCESANMLQQEPEAADEIVTEKPPTEESTIESMKSTSNISSPKRSGGSSSSSSESETYSERSQNKIYKHGDKLRVSLKRLSTQELSPCKGIKMTPPSPTISACSSSSSSNKSIFSESSMKARKQSTRKRSKRLEQPELHQENPNVSICSENKPTFKHKKEQIATLALNEGNSTELKDVKQKYDESSTYPVIEENSCEQNDRNQNDLKNIKNSEVEEEEENINVKETFLRNVEEVNTINVDDRELKDEQFSVKKEEMQETENKELPETESTTFISVEKTMETEILSEEDNGDPDKEISVELYEKYIEEESLQEVKEKSTNESYNDEIKAVENENITSENELKGHEKWIGNKNVKEIDQIKCQEEAVVLEESEKGSGTVAITDHKKIYALRETIDTIENESQKLVEDLVEELDEEEIKQQTYADALNVENKDINEEIINQNDELITEYIEIREDNEISNKIDMEELTEIIIDQEDSKETDNLENNEFAIDENEETKKVREESSAQYETQDLNQDHTEEQNVVLMQESDFMNVMPSNETDQLDDKILFSSSIEETLYEEATGSIVIPIVEKEEIVETVTLPFEESTKEPQEEAEVIIDTQLCTDPQSYTSPEIPNLPKEIRMSNEIRLPPKKQLKKLIDADDTTPSATSVTPKLHSLVSQITEQVNVETKTLLDILKTVQSNATAAATANKSPAGKISPTCDSDSPGRSPSGGSSSPQALVVKKATTVRRYERRRRGGEEEIFHKTLEETFAEIAAESSKQILEMVTSRNELAEAIEASLADNLKTPSLVEETLEATDKIVLEYETKKEPEKEATETAQTETHVAETECKDIADDPNAMTHGNNSPNNTRTKSPQEENALVSREVIEEPAENTSTDIQPYGTDLKISDNKNEPLVVKTPMKRGRKPKAKVKETIQTVMEINNENIDHSLITHQSENVTEELEKPTEENPTQSQNDVLQFTSDVIFKDVNHEDLNEHSVKSDYNQQAHDEITIAQKTEESLVILDIIKDQNESENQEEIWKIQDVQQDSEKINLSEQILNPVENQKEVGEIEIPQLEFVQPKELHNTIENPIKLIGEITENIAENAEIMKETKESKNIDEKPEFIIEEGGEKCEVEKLPVEEIIKLKQEVVQIGTLQKDPVIPKDITDAIQSKSIPIAPPKKRFLKAQMDAEYNIVASANKIENHTTTTDANTSKKKARKNTKAITMLKEEVPAGTEKEATPTSTSKRGAKPKQKLTTEAQNSESTVSQSSTKKNTKKLIEDIANQQLVESSPKSFEKKIKKLDKKKFLEPENDADGKTITTVDDKSAKKKRQKKLKESFEAVLMENSPEIETYTNDNPTDETMANNANKFSEEQMFPSTPNTLSPQSTSPLHHLSLTSFESDQITASAADPSEAMTNITPAFTAIAIEPDEDPDPLKDIEKFIEDGVNLLKRGYKVGDDNDDSVDGAVLNAAKKLIKEDLDRTPIKEDTGQLLQSSDIPSFTSFADTPADTPLATPTATPPPKSPVGPETSPFLLSDVDTYALSGGVRRSHRIKQNSKMPKAMVGRGLVREKERFSLKDDVETKTPYTIDDHRMDLAEVEAKNAKFLKDMEERLSNFRVIKENEYKCERVVSKEAKKMICDCFLTADEEERGELACGEDCLNRLLMIECGPDCNIKERCANKRFQKFLCSPCRVFRTEKKGFGLLADIEILSGEFIMEYVGEVINGDEFERRRFEYSLDKNRHYYFMALRSDAIIDATNKGNISRFINHSCDPNAETQKWTVNGELRIGFFSKKSIMPGEEITFDYQYQRYGREAQRCYCESVNCRGWIGEEPNSDEGEQIGEDSECDEEEEENLAERLLADDDEDDSDETEADAEEARKKLEIAAAEAKLMPITEEYKKDILENAEMKQKKSDPDALIDGKRNSPEEDSKSKFKKLLCKMAEKVAKKKKQKETQRKRRNRRDDATTGGAIGKLLNSRYLEDPDIEDEVNFLSRCGLKNQSDTLRLSRLVVRAKLVQTRLNLLKILRNGELPCRRLFLDYHGLRLLHGWISEDGGDLDIRLALLETLESLPIANKTMLTDSKVYQAVRSWCSNGAVTGNGGNSLSPSDESSKESTTSQLKPTNPPQQEVPTELKNLALKLTATWDSLPEIFRIPKRERIEQMKEHEREADRQYAVTAARDDEARRSSTSNSDRYQRDRFSRNGGSGSSGHRFSWPRGGSGIGGKESRNISVLGTNTDPRRRGTVMENMQQSPSESTKHLSKEERRQMFAAKVARDEAEKRFTEERREFETKCRFFGLDPKRTRPQHLPFCVNPSTGQWYSVDRQPIPTPPSYAHVQVPVRQLSTNPDDYQLPAAALNLSHKWKFAITPQGKIYYYHVEFRVPQWEPPTPAQMYGDNADQVDAATSTESESDGDADDSTDDNDEIIKGMEPSQLEAFIEEKVESRRQQRYSRLVDERSISPRREEDRIYNQMEVRKYKENKEKIRKRKEEIRRRRLEALKNSTLNMCTLGSPDNVTAGESGEAVQPAKMDTDESVLPIQDYLLSSDEEDIKAECNNSPLIDKIVQGDKIVDELDALTKKALKRPLPPHLELPTGITSDSEAATTTVATSESTVEKHEHHKKRKIDKRESSKSGKKNKDQDSKYRKLKEKFRCEIAGIIVQHLKPYRKEECSVGRIQSNEDFNHLARKLTHFVMIKELKYCESVGQTLVVTESVKNKSREFIKKYMAKYGDVYARPENDPDFKDIPFSL